MFQKLGLKDILQEIWYRKLIIIAIAIIAVLISVMDVFVIRDNQPSKTETETTYTKSVLINVDALDKSEFYDSFSQSQKMRNNYVAACQTEFLAAYLIEKIEVEDKSLSEMLIPVENEDKKIEFKDKNIEGVWKSLVFEKLGDSTSFKVTFTCYDDEIGEKILNAIVPFMKEQTELGEAEFTELGRFSYAETTESEVNQPNIIKPLIKDLIIFGFGLEALYLLAALLKVVLMPAIHEKNDIKTYFDVPVWETK